MKSEDGHEMVRAILVGNRRAWLKVVGKNETEDSQYMHGEIEIIEEPQFEIDEHLEESVRDLRDMISENLTAVSMDDSVTIKDSNGLSLFTDSIAHQLPIIGKQKHELLRMNDPRKRLAKLLDIVAVMVKQHKITAEPSSNIGSPQVSKELEWLQEKIEEAGLPEEARTVVDQEMRRLSIMGPSSSEYFVTLNYVEWLASLPWSTMTEDSLDIEKAQECLDEDHYGLEKVKERVVEYLAVRKLVKENTGTILCLVGPPGTGKTSLGKSVARSIGRKFVRMSLGGLRDEAEIRGHRRTYVGALPGRIIQNIKKIGVRNPVFMLDEIDKLGVDFRGDPAAALLEVLDPEQNVAFVDTYLGTPFDLSEVMFIMTANEIGPIPPALYDRMEVIEIPGYSPFDKLRIATQHLIPKQKEKNGVKDCEFTVSDESVQKVIEEYTSEAGVRNLERQCGTIIRKVAVLVASDKEPPSTIGVDLVTKYLGPPKVFAEKAAEKPEVGLSAGLAWSRHGGSLLFVETSLVPGKGKIILTGNLGDVLQESAQAAYTWIKSQYETLGVDLKMLSEYDVHVHLPAGATPKDGPSAGVAIASAMLSLYLNKPVRNDIAMTGEITLRGRVMPIGGLKEKILAAHRAGIKIVMHPVQNIADLEEIPQDVLDEMDFIPIRHISDATSILFIDSENADTNDSISAVSEESLINKENLRA
jgi:ATP-dependent Lon protease